MKEMLVSVLFVAACGQQAELEIPAELPAPIIDAVPEVPVAAPTPIVIVVTPHPTPRPIITEVYDPALEATCRKKQVEYSDWSMPGSQSAGATELDVRLSLENMARVCTAFYRDCKGTQSYWQGIPWHGQNLCGYVAVNSRSAGVEVTYQIPVVSE